MRGQRLVIPFAALAIIVAAGLYLFAQVVVPWGTARALEKAVKSSCDTCELKIGAVGFSFLTPGQLDFRNVSFKGGDNERTGVFGSVGQILADVSVLPLMAGRIHFDKLTFVKPDIAVQEGNKADPPAGPPQPKDSPLFSFQILQTVISNGHFTYVNTSRGYAVLKISRIEATIGKVGTVKELVNEMTEAHTTAQLEQSGQIDLNIRTYVFKRPIHADIDLKLSKQNLADVTPFFKITDGIRLQGSIQEGASGITVRDRHLDAWVFAKYEKLDVELEKRADRSPVAVYFTNLAAELQMNDKNLKKERRDQKRSVSLERHKDESLVSFILRGMKESALKVATTPSSKKT